MGRRALVSIATIAASIAVMSTMHAQRPARGDVRAAPAIPTADVAGIVVADDAVKRPVRNVLVMIAGTDVALIRVTATDNAGRFAFAGLPPGRYLVGAGKPAYGAALLGARRPGGPGALVVLGAGEKRNDLALTLARGAAIAGRVLDENGQPIAGSRVRVMQYRLVAGEVTLIGDLGEPAGATTDDRGAYRIYDLPPGDFAVAVQARVIGGGDVRVLSPADIDAAAHSTIPTSAAPRAGAAPASPVPAIGYAPVYFPSTSIAAQATPLTLAAGQERTDVDLTTRLVRFARVDGLVTLAGGPTPAALQVALRPRTLDAAGVILTGNNVRAAPDGRFTFGGVPPGEYTIAVRTLPAPVSDMPAPPAPPMWAMTDITLNGENLTNVALHLQPALTVAGRVTFEGLPRPPESGRGIRIGLRATPASGQPGVPEPVTMDAGGGFTLRGLLPGKYWLFVQIPATDGVTQIPDWVAKSAIVNGRDALDVPFELAPGAGTGDAVVTLSDEIQELTGTVRDGSGQPVRNRTIVIFAADRRFWFPQSRRTAVRQSDAQGEFVFGLAAGLPPGEYFVATLPDIAPNEQFDPALLDVLVRSAQRVTLAEGASQAIELRVSVVGGGR